MQDAYWRCTQYPQRAESPTDLSLRAENARTEAYPRCLTVARCAQAMKQAMRPLAFEVRLSAESVPQLRAARDSTCHLCSPARHISCTAVVAHTDNCGVALRIHSDKSRDTLARLLQTPTVLTTALVTAVILSDCTATRRGGRLLHRNSSGKTQRHTFEDKDMGQ